MREPQDRGIEERRGAGAGRQGYGCDTGCHLWFVSPLHHSRSPAVRDLQVDTCTTGFSFKPPLRRPFDRILSLLGSSSAPILSVDIPSGWDVERGRQKLETEPDDQGRTDVVETFMPDALISLTVPKLGVGEFKGKHWLGGRFVPEYVSCIHQLHAVSGTAYNANGVQ